MMAIALVALIEKAKIATPSSAFCHRCITKGRRFYLNGFRREAIALMSIAWDRGYREYNGPLLENVFAKCFGVTSYPIQRGASSVKRIPGLLFRVEKEFISAFDGSQRYKGAECLFCPGLKIWQRNQYVACQSYHHE